jgi:hypothetical protein
VHAFHSRREKLGLTDRSDPVTRLLAHRIIELAREGIRDPVGLCKAVKRLATAWPNSEHGDPT